MKTAMDPLRWSGAICAVAEGGDFAPAPLNALSIVRLAASLDFLSLKRAV